MSARDEGLLAGLLFKSLVGTAALLLAAFLLWALRSLIVPVLVSGLLAYICRPMVSELERFRIPRGLAIGLLLLVVALAALFVVDRLRTLVPSQTGAVELKIRALYAINERYRGLMELDPTLTKGNRLYQFVRADSDPLLDRVNQLLALPPEERSLFLASRSGGAATSAAPDRLLDQDRANLQTIDVRTRAARIAPGAASLPPRPAELYEGSPAAGRPVSYLAQLLSNWIIAPLVFLFLLSDTGQLKRGLLSMVPNRLFEPALIVLADLDHALGDWLRGLFLESCLLGITVALLLTVVGIPLRWAIGIGLFAAATNAVPYLGSAVALLGGLAYALLAQEIHPLIPMVSIDNLAIWVIAAVVLAEVIKSAVYEPVVLGGAVKLHPLVVVIGVTGGAILFGFVGVLLAVPAISMFKVFVASTARQLNAYGLI
ncbi:MAG TPA: AI-2E family transporter [Burkholderiales bacterium]|nr:AI-2E family transporter [Burkholderiales bacterium]